MLRQNGLGDDQVNRKKFPFPDRESSMKILQNDACYGKIPPDQVQRVFDDAWSVGTQEAKGFIREHCQEDFDMLRVLRQLGFQIVEQDIDYIMGNIRYFCEYLPGKNQIYIYTKGIGLWAQTNGLPFDAARNIILAHEFFHYLEANGLGWVSRRCMVPMLKLGKFSIGKTGIAALSEVAANAFSNEYYAAYMESLPETEADDISMTGGNES